MEVIHYASHRHELELKSSNMVYRPYLCNGCRDFGFGLRRFRCKQCHFDFHEECAHVKQTTTHDLYNNNIFKFFPQPPHHRSRILHCAECGYSVQGFVYYCEELELCIHPCCHSLPSKFKFYHLEFRLRDQILSSTCLWCSNDSDFPIEGLSYVSKCNKYNFHVCCAKHMMHHEVVLDGVHLGKSLEQSLQCCLEIHLGGILKRQRRRNIVMSLVTTNLVLELSSAVLDQVSSSSVNKTRFALFGMLISSVAMLTCVLELIYEFRTEKPIWRWSSALPFPWYYDRDEGRKPFGTFKDIFGLVCALCQCVLATVSYCYLRQQADNLIRISFFPIIFAFGILFSQILKNQDTKISSCGNETRALTDNNLDQSLQGCLEIHLGGISKRQRRRNIVMSFAITNLVLELSSAILDQVSSSMNKTRFALFGMLISSVAMLTSIIELIYEFRTENLIWRWSSALPFPWYYYRDQGRKPFGTFKDIVGLVCALCQFVLATTVRVWLKLQMRAVRFESS
ncbi:hypothetical protein Q3G72_026597 [Acer saccharum]|nr:hypothetical protein Q3G72_026597 [Acer saccharum]